jgi:hypothetical protein
MKALHVIFVVQSAPSAVGHGSNHRAYQVAHDLGQIVGPERVMIFDYNTETRLAAQASAARTAVRGLADRSPGPLPAWLHRQRQSQREWGMRLRGWAQEQQRLLVLLAGRPGQDSLPGANRSLARHDDPRVLQRYLTRLQDLPRPAICVVRHSNFARLATANRRLGIPTLACPANLEALDVGAGEIDGQARQRYLAALNLADELRLLAACDERLFISRVEAGLVSGLGMSAGYYPYRPVGAIRQGCEKVRQARQRTPQEPGLLVMVGSADHPTTRQSFHWLLSEARRQGLPAGAHLVVCGRGSDSLLPPGDIPAGVELRGWVEQEEMERLLVRAQGALLPQRTGFGGLTRLAELSCAGVPALVSAHALHAVCPPPPGVIPIPDRWDAWRMAVESMLQAPVPPGWEDYQAWEAIQENPLPGVLANIAPDGRPLFPSQPPGRS